MPYKSREHIKKRLNENEKETIKKNIPLIVSKLMTLKVKINSFFRSFDKQNCDEK